MPSEKSGTSFRSGYHNNVRTDIFHLIPENPGRILDVGGGTGATSAAIKQRYGGDRVVVVDGADATPEYGVDLFMQGNLDNPDLWDQLETSEGGFDTILCLDVLEHLIDPWTTVRRCSGLLNKGGHIIVSLPNARNYQLSFPLFFLGKLSFRKSGVLDRTHLRWFVRRTAISLIQVGGLELRSCSGGWYMDRAKWWERLAKFGFAPGFLFQIYYLKAQKRG